MHIQGSLHELQREEPSQRDEMQEMRESLYNPTEEEETLGCGRLRRR